jgi:DNA-binding response OmpR family regulator
MAKIAIIEDDESVRMLYQLKLKNDGFDVETAINGAEGLKLIETYQPDLVLLDLMMPELSGDQVLAEMRKQPWGATIKVIIITNIVEEEAPTAIKDLGISGFIIKAQYTPSQLSQLVSQTLAS